MTNYSNGRRAEWAARDELIKQGYTVTRSAGSKGCIDLVAWNYDGTRLVQVKKGSGRATPKEREALAAFDIPPHSTVEIWHRESGQWEVEKVRSRE